MKGRYWDDDALEDERLEYFPGGWHNTLICWDCGEVIEEDIIRYGFQRYPLCLVCFEKRTSAYPLLMDRIYAMALYAKETGQDLYPREIERAITEHLSRLN